jgi:hypothetical protein
MQDRGPVNALDLDADEQAQALSNLRETRGDLLCARVSALQASATLSGARAQRARELSAKIADAIAHVERLAFFVEGDR